ncbi:MAG: EAL domain-containing protein, partial [Xanthomonadales bacterium]|nr:EAL domain-containing protein [Xanthomonadales bacterium]
LMDRSWQSVVQRMHDQIAHQATHDELTGLLNRKEFERRLKLKVSESKLVDSQHIAMLADLDQFRVVNASAGHEAGDRLLQNVAELLKQVLPDNAEVARVGPDDFAILVPRCDSGRGHELANKLKRAVAEHNTGWLTRRLRVTMSVGVVAVNRDSSSIWDVFNRLEVACDAAKEEGDRIRSFEVDDTDLSRRSKAVAQVQELEKALDTDRIELHGHLIKPLHASDETGAHYEVLSRIRADDGSTIPPDDFVPAAEAYGRIHMLDERVIDRTLALLAASGGKGIDKLAVNISGRTFNRPRFVEFLRQKLEEYEVSPSLLCLEITESAAMADLSRCADVLRELRYLGCSLSLDDFGTGLSSFGYLKHLPVDFLKIDGSFVREIDRSRSDYGLVKTMHETARLLGKRTIAEYAESDAIIDALDEIGIDYVQGYGVEKPRPLSKILGE